MIPLYQFDDQELTLWLPRHIHFTLSVPYHRDDPMAQTFRGARYIAHTSDTTVTLTVLDKEYILGRPQNT